MSKLRHPASFLDRIPKQTYLWLAIAIFGASNSVTRKLTEIGAENFVGGHNPISLCNVLFVGNLCALLVLIFIYRRQLHWAELQQRTQKEWVGMIAVAVLAGALAPGLIFQALSLTGVNNVVLVGRLEPPLTLALSVWFLKERVNTWDVMGAVVAFIGVALTILLQPTTAKTVEMAGISVGLGEALAIAGSAALAGATIIGKKRLARVPLGLYSIIRTALGTVVFFVAALGLYGSNHFMDAFSPFLWQWMLLYGSLIVVVGQSFWISGLRASTIAQASLVSSFMPIAAIFSAYIILGEAPTLAQYAGGSIILAGVFLSHIGTRQKSLDSVVSMPVRTAETEQKLSSKMGFKGI